MRYAIIDNSTRKVTNLIIWEGSEWTPPRDTIVVPSEIASIGDAYEEATGLFIPPIGVAHQDN